MRIGHICLTTCFSGNSRSCWREIVPPRRKTQLAQIFKENWLLFRNREFFFSDFLSYFMEIESKYLRSYKLVWGGGKSP